MLCFLGERDGRGGSVTSADPFPLPVQLVPINPACCRRCELRAFGAPPPQPKASKPSSPFTAAQTKNNPHKCTNPEPLLESFSKPASVWPQSRRAIRQHHHISPAHLLAGNPPSLQRRAAQLSRIIVTSNVLGAGTGSMSAPYSDGGQEALTIRERTGIHQYVFHSRPAWFRPHEMLANISRYSLNARTRRSL